MRDMLIATLSFGLVIGCLVLARIKSRSQFEVKSPDIVLALIPIALWLFLTGRISELGIGDLTIKSAILEASRAAVSDQVSTQQVLPVDPVEPVAKRGVDEIPRIIERKAEALSFQLGHGGYYGPAIESYLKELTRHNFLKHVVLLDPDGTLFGILDARELAQHVGDDVPPEAFAEWLNRADRSALSRLPGFTSGREAVTPEAQRDEVLEKMETLELDLLPVVDGENRFVGVVDRSRVSAAMLIEIARLLTREKTS